MDLIEFISRRLKDQNGQLSVWGKSAMENYRRVANLPTLPEVKWCRSKGIMLFGVRAYGLMRKETQEQCHLVLRARDLLRLKVVPPSFNFDLAAYKNVHGAISSSDKSLLLDLETRIERTLERVKPSIFIANCTIDPIGRFWIRKAAENGIKTLCLQHGIWREDMPSYAQEEDIVDKYIAFDESQAKIVSRNIPPKKILLLGERSCIKWAPPVDRALRICFVGEDWERYGYEKIKQKITKSYLELVANLSKTANKDYKFFYKKHPSEINTYGIEGNISITREISNMDVFIGYSSSLLKDMSSQGKLSIQVLMDTEFRIDNFQKNGYCISMPLNKSLAENIQSYLKSSGEIPCIRNNSIENLIS